MRKIIRKKLKKKIIKKINRCEPGYVLSGASQVKCRDGFWSGKIPICIGNDKTKFSDQKDFI